MSMSYVFYSTYTVRDVVGVLRTNGEQIDHAKETLQTDHLGAQARTEGDRRHVDVDSTALASPICPLPPGVAPGGRSTA